MSFAVAPTLQHPESPQPPGAADDGASPAAGARRAPWATALRAVRAFTGAAIGVVLLGRYEEPC